MNSLCFSITTDAIGSTPAVEYQPAEEARQGTPFQQLLRNRSASFLPTSHTGITVNEQSAMRLAAVYSSIRIIAETIASLPVHVHEVSATGTTTRTRMHPVAELLCCEPNADQTPLVFTETTMQHVLGHGNTYSAIRWSNRTGEPVELRHFHPSEVEVGRDPDTFELLYQVSSDTYGSEVFDASEMLHVPGLGNGICGFSPVRYFAESIGLGLAQERFAGLYFAQGAKPNIIVESEQELGDEAFNNLQKAINTGFSGDRAFGALLLEGGVKATAVSIPMNEAQLLESRNFSGQDISQRMFRIPAHISGYTWDLKYDHMEQADLQFAKHCLRPWLVRREQEIERKLFRRSERGRFEVRHQLDGLLRADLKTRYEAHNTGILSAFLTINEARSHENLPAVDGGDRIILAESVFGQQDGGTSPDNDDSNQQDDNQRATDPRLRAMLRQTLKGLLHREVVFAERMIGRGDWQTRCREFYGKHRQLIDERLQLLEVDLAAVHAGIDQRADELLDITTADGVDELFARHAEYLEPLVDELLDKKDSDE